MLETIATVVSILGGIAGVAFGVIQHLGKRAESTRANKAEEAQAQMALELAGTREELARTREAHERLADLEGRALSDAQRAERRDRAAQRQRDVSAARQERQQKTHDARMLGEAKKQSRAAEKALKELQRQGRKK